MSKNPHSWRNEWDFARRYNFNHGSLGASPVKVLQAKEALDREINRDREQFIREGGWARIEAARTNLANFIKSHPDNIVLTTNITDSLNSVLKSLSLGPDDEVLITNHMYTNYPGLVNELSLRQGFKFVRADIPYRLADEQQIVDAIMSAITSRTRLAIIDHITSSTAFVFPVKKIVAALKTKGVDTFVDGAHAPGQIDLNVEDIGAAYYGGNTHKWLSAPLSGGFLYVRPDKQGLIVPAVGSGFARAELPFTERFSWQGVIDFSSRILITDTLQFMADMHPEGWSGIYKRNHDLAVTARREIADTLKVELPVPDSMIGSMFTLPLGNLIFSDKEMEKSALHRGYDWMVEHYGFGTTFSQFGDEYLVRVTCHLYNEADDYRVLAKALNEFVRTHS